MLVVSGLPSLCVDLAQLAEDLGEQVLVSNLVPIFGRMLQVGPYLIVESQIVHQ